MASLLAVDNLTTYFKEDAKLTKAVDGVSFHIEEGEVIGIVGESGCGKTTIMMSLLQLIPIPPGQVRGSVIFEGSDILKYKQYSNEMRSIRGGKIGMIFQEPSTSLNPIIKIEQQLIDTIGQNPGLSKAEILMRMTRFLRMVGVPETELFLNYYPYQLSTGMQQKVMIAMALSGYPKILMADEPTAELDITTQAQILDFIHRTIIERNAALILATRNLSIIARYANRVYIMYAGRIVEEAPCKELFHNPLHPYTIAMLQSLPRLDQAKASRLQVIWGKSPDPANLPNHCAFLPRCSHRTDICRFYEPPLLKQVSPGHSCACYVRIENNT